MFRRDSETTTFPYLSFTQRQRPARTESQVLIWLRAHLLALSVGHRDCKYRGKTVANSNQIRTARQYHLPKGRITYRFRRNKSETESRFIGKRWTLIGSTNSLIYNEWHNNFWRENLGIDRRCWTLIGSVCCSHARSNVMHRKVFRGRSEVTGGTLSSASFL